MLTHLTIRNFALVSELDVNFEKGLTVITGESGAGKSILLNALGLVLGERAQQSYIHPDATQCEVYAEFDLDGIESSLTYIRETELHDEEEPSKCIVRRIATSDGRSRAWLNGNLVNLSTLRDLCGQLVGVHSQFEQRELMSPEVQLRWLDDYLAKPDLLQTVHVNYSDWQAEEKALQQKKLEVQNANERHELLKFQVEELRNFNIQEDEFEQLSTRFKRLSQLQSLLDSLNTICKDLDGTGIPAIGRASTELQRMKDAGQEIESAQKMLDTALINLEEVSRQLNRFGDSLSADGDSLDSVSDRLDEWHHLSRKHKVDATRLHSKAEELETELELLQQSDALLEQAVKVCDQKREDFYRPAKQLSRARKQASENFAGEVIETLCNIGMRDTEFKLDFDSTISSTGLESVDYLLSANSRFEPQSLNQIASGGELSRISLAILVVVAQRSKLPCLILDEADIGVGGTTADEVGRTLRDLSERTQVICITHAPQVAALADKHLLVTKRDEQGVEVEPLNQKGQIEELARMVGGQEINAESRKYAAVLLKEAKRASS